MGKISEQNIKWFVRYRFLWGDNNIYFVRRYIVEFLDPEKYFSNKFGSVGFSVPKKGRSDGSRKKKYHFWLQP